MSQAENTATPYQRYHIHTEETPEISAMPSRFLTRVGKVGLASHLIHEILRTKADMPVVTSRPCMYGVYSGPIGGFAPRPHKCVACLLCTVEYSRFVRISPNPARRRMGDSYFTWEHVEAILYEAESGRVPVKGAGYRGPFGGAGWDGMWTDMSEIVRPTRDGIHGREFISTVVDIGAKPAYLTLDEHKQPVGALPQVIQLPLPILFDAPPDALATAQLAKIYLQAAQEIQTLVILPIQIVLEYNLNSPAIVPLVTAEEWEQVRVLPFTPRMLEMTGWNERLYDEIRATFPSALVCLRTHFIAGEELLNLAQKGIRIFHMLANYHGRSPDKTFVFDLIRAAHQTLVEARCRDEFTLLGSGGIVAAEHTPKAIIAGLDAVCLDTPLLVALQGRLGRGNDELKNRHRGACKLPRAMPSGWAVQRIKNMIGAWRDQMLEMMGAMGLREVRRLRGEMGRAMFQKALERETFAGIEGYEE